ncbi:MAG: hypothetical protein WCR65_02475 [Parcubacteria group bacterium]|jgi:hypothetical protein
MDLSNYKIKKTKITNERQMWIGKFLDRINAERRHPYKPITPARMGMILSPMNLSQIKAFYGECNDARHFSKYFWWKVK